MLEEDMVDKCYKYLLVNKNYNKIVREVPFLSRCIDMVLITQDNKNITIEFKMKDWRHALVQVRSHKLGADRAYICLPVKKPSNILLNALAEENVGLYLYSPDRQDIMYEYLPAPENTRRVEAFASILQEKTIYIAENCAV